MHTLQRAAKSDSKFYFCDENENHIATSGPKGSKIVQYVACQKFTEITPSERFQLLRKKGYCIQCLFPVVYQDKGKHSDGKCDFEKRFCLQTSVTQQISNQKACIGLS